jgi:uncharacterized protein
MVVLAAACTGKQSAPDGVVMLPGALPVSRELAARIGRGAPGVPGERIETRHLRDGAPIYTNRLSLESSPYLRLHAHNPVDWRPWGDEAFADARRLGRPILVSIGYSTCHWCHVMAAESFEDVDIATYLNQHYIAIKVDREERPDVDATYLKVIEAMGRPGGWPLNVWLTPEGKPFFAATYLPPRDGDRGAASGFLTVLRRGRELLDRDRDALSRDADQIAAALGELTRPAAPGAGLGAPALRHAVERTRRNFDAENGGLGRRGQRNKFPADLPVRLLLRYARRTGDAEALRMAELTLEKMAAGGIRDHLGGGFHRYSTDPQWRVPHFEKMLYDNALLAVAYLEGYQATGRADFAEVAREILELVEREMRTHDADYVAALDADSAAGPGGRMVEGVFYTWTPGEVEAALGPGDASRLVRAYYGVSQAGNFDGRSVLSVTRPLGEVAASLGLDEARAASILGEARPRLLAARDRRPRPHRDDKVLTGWNGLMISALVRAALVLDRGAASSQYLERAKNVARAMRKHRDRNGLSRTRPRGDWLPATLEDHAFLMAGLIDLYEATADSQWRLEVDALDDELAKRFEDPAGGFYSIRQGSDPRLLREKPFEDGAVPSGNSVMALSLLRLAELTGRDEYRARADRLLVAASGAVGTEPAASSELLVAVDWRTDEPLEIALVAPTGRDQLAPFLEVLARRFVPNRVVLAGTEAELVGLAVSVPWLAEKKAPGGKPTAYVCMKGVCKLPARDGATFEKQLAGARPLP